MSLLEFSFRLGLACICGMAIGFERQWRHKSAGLRTNTLVATGSAAFVLVSFLLAAENVDVTRIIGQVVTGIGFLGAGVIIRQGAQITGLTTAATIWCSAAVGSLAAAGFYTEALICAGLIILVNSTLVYVDAWLKKRHPGSENKPE